jgi:acetyl-CoA synthetase
MAPEKPKSAIETLQVDVKKYPPPAAFAAQANAKPEIYDQELEAFWDKEAKSRISWFKPYHKVLEWNLPYAKWFVGGELNICYNCVDRHVEAGKGAKVAYYWEGEGVGERKTITYSDLLKDVVKLTNGLRKLGVKKGTHCGIYIAMVPELPVLMLALARIGAPFTVVFAGFSPDSLADRFNDMEVEQAAAPQGQRGRGPQAGSHGEEDGRLQAHRRGHGDAGRARPLVARRDRRAER